MEGGRHGGSEAVAVSQRGSVAWRGGGGDNGDGDDNSDVLVVGARSGVGDGGSGTDACGDDGDTGWTPSLTFREQPLEREETPFFSQMTAWVCRGGSLPLL